MGFTCGTYKRASAKQKRALKSAGAVWPTPRSLARFTRMLSRARGYHEPGACGRLAQKRPASPTSGGRRAQKRPATERPCGEEPDSLKSGRLGVKEAAVARA